MKIYVGRVIRRKRRMMDLTLDKLDEKVGVSGNYLSQIERGVVDLKISTLARIAAALGMSLSELFQEAEKEQKENPVKE